MNSEDVASRIKECLPVDNIDDLLLWKRNEVTWASLVKPLNKRTEHCEQGYPLCSLDSEFNTKRSFDHPKTLVCHDMKGGYGADRWVNGTDNSDEYKFVTWPCIDIFVYFSHNLVTIPPLCWINAGHIHGVKVLGTLITEGNKGVEIWKKLFLDKTKLNNFAVQLAEICHHYGFDGYLLNIENPMSHQVLNSFMSFLEQLVHNLKSNAPDNMVIWYDAVTYPFGELRWQNKLNLYNRRFFDMCDGIFLNYGWTEEDLIQSVKEASARQTDVYVGIDVFGRGVYGGGGFTSCEALNVIRKHGLSAAIFAPGWVYENCEEDENPDNRDFMFWELLQGYLYCHGPAQLPFQTSFSRGYGLKKYKEGMIVNDYPWFNLSEMNHMPALLSGLHEVEESPCVLYYQNDAYNGGGCLLIKQRKLSKNIEDHKDRLFVCDLHCVEENNIIITVITKPLATSSDSGINFFLNLIDHKNPSSHTEEPSKRELCLSIKYELGTETSDKWITRLLAKRMSSEEMFSEREQCVVSKYGSTLVHITGNTSLQDVHQSGASVVNDDELLKSVSQDSYMTTRGLVGTTVDSNVTMITLICVLELLIYSALIVCLLVIAPMCSLVISQLRVKKLELNLNCSLVNEMDLLGV